MTPVPRRGAREQMDSDMATTTSDTRPDGLSYIDVPQPRELAHSQVTVPTPAVYDEQSGSSTEEELSDRDDIAWDDNTAASSSSHSSRYSERGGESPQYDSEDIEDEDWDLAHRDFTKQYNRMRQHRAATGQALHGESVSSRPPLPAQNRPASQKSQQEKLPPSIANTLANAKISTAKQTRDKKDRATQDQVMDGRTRTVIAGLTNRGLIGRLERCISSGKEANVYFASPSNPLSRPTAVKIYRTSILKFRARQNYIVGEHRFQGEYSASKNARKMVRVWAEKELRNLKRLEQGGIKAPRVIEGTGNVLVMEFLGDDEIYISAAPRLKDADIDGDRWQDLYIELLIIMRRMYATCHLVHADLSEYNILYHHEHLHIIDVSQSVEHDHPKAMEFLRTDIKNISLYFKRQAGDNFAALSIRRAWEFIILPRLAAADQVEDDVRLAEIAHDWLTAEDSIATGNDEARDDEGVFMATFIPQSLGDLRDPETAIEIKGKEGDAPIVLTEMANLGLQEEVVELENDSASSSSETEEVEGDSVPDPALETVATEKAPRGFRHEDREDKKNRKQAVKAEKREKRESKMPKGEKKKLIKLSKGKR